MQKKEIIESGVTGILILILIFAVIRAVKKAGEARGSKDKQTASTVFVKEGPAEEKHFQGETISGSNFEKLREEGRDLELKTDPFSGAPILPEKALSSGIYLNGILWDETSPLAIINDEVVKIGDRVGEYAVVKIKKDSVILSNGSSELELRL